MGQIAEQSAFIIQYGDVKQGKTGDCGFSFPRAKWIAAPGALKPLLGLCGYEPPEKDQHNVESIKDATEIVAKLAPKSFDAVVVDDLTLLVDRTVAKLTKSGSGGYDLWAAVHAQLLALRETARRCGMHVVLNCHATPPHNNDGTFYKGSLALPGKTLPYKIPAAADLVLHAEPAPAATVSFGWPVLYRCDPADPTWVTGDRHNVTPDYAPMNLAEILRLIAQVNHNPTFAPRRLPGLEWQEKIVEAVALKLQGVLADDEATGAILKQTFEGCLAKFTKDERHALWAVRDALARATLRLSLSGHRRKHFKF